MDTEKRVEHPRKSTLFASSSSFCGFQRGPCAALYAAGSPEPIFRNLRCELQTCSQNRLHWWNALELAAQLAAQEPLTKLANSDSQLADQLAARLAEKLAARFAAQLAAKLPRRMSQKASRAFFCNTLVGLRTTTNVCAAKRTEPRLNGDWG